MRTLLILLLAVSASSCLRRYSAIQHPSILQIPASTAKCEHFVKPTRVVCSYTQEDHKGIRWAYVEFIHAGPDPESPVDYSVTPEVGNGLLPCVPGHKEDPCSKKFDYFADPGGNIFQGKPKGNGPIDGGVLWVPPTKPNKEK